jgi:hypothetical protein
VNELSTYNICIYHVRESELFWANIERFRIRGFLSNVSLLSGVRTLPKHVKCLTRLVNFSKSRVAKFQFRLNKSLLTRRNGDNTEQGHRCLFWWKCGEQLG